MKLAAGYLPIAGSIGGGQRGEPMPESATPVLRAIHMQGDLHDRAPEEHRQFLSHPDAKDGLGARWIRRCCRW